MRHFQGQGEREGVQSATRSLRPSSKDAEAVLPRCGPIAPESIPKYRWNSVCKEQSKGGHVLTFC